MQKRQYLKEDTDTAYKQRYANYQDIVKTVHNLNEVVVLLTQLSVIAAPEPLSHQFLTQQCQQRFENIINVCKESKEREEKNNNCNPITIEKQIIQIQEEDDDDNAVDESQLQLEQEQQKFEENIQQKQTLINSLIATQKQQTELLQQSQTQPEEHWDNTNNQIVFIKFPKKFEKYKPTASIPKKFVNQQRKYEIAFTFINIHEKRRKITKKIKFGDFLGNDFIDHQDASKIIQFKNADNPLQENYWRQHLLNNKECPTLGQAFEYYADRLKSLY